MRPPQAVTAAGPLLRAPHAGWPTHRRAPRDRAPVALVGDLVTAGAHETPWDLGGGSGRRVHAGIYLVELRAGAQRTTTRVAVLW